MALLGGPLSTTTSPSPVDKASTFAPPTSSTAMRSVTRLCALRQGMASAPSRNSLRFILHARDRARAVAELVALHPDLLQNRQVQIRDRRALRQHNMLPQKLHLPRAAANQDIRLRIIVVQVRS